MPTDTPSTATSQPNPHVEPRDAATLIVVDISGPEPRFLMGRRRTDLVFMPGRFVFPGGRVDDADKVIPASMEPVKIEVHKLLAEMRGHPSAVRARALVLAAIRETFEETGLIIGDRAAGNQPPPTDHKVWSEFLGHGFVPDAACLTFFARAITPPGRPRRFDTRFFCVPRSAVRSDIGRVDDELSEIDWYTPAETIERDLPPITRVIIEDLADRLKAGPLQPSAIPVPFYHQNRGVFRRDLLRFDQSAA